jgi:hypothetical protein
MNWPATSADLRRAGYDDLERAEFCRCGEILFWFLSPEGERMIQLAVDSEGRFAPHQANCRDVKFHEKLERKKRAARQGVLFGGGHG